MRDTVDNPAGLGLKRPYPVNESAFSEDNPHIERLNDSTLILFLDDHAGAHDLSDVCYMMSHVDDQTWQIKKGYLYKYTLY